LRNIQHIALKELRIYLTTPTSYVLFATFLAFCGLNFVDLVRDFQNQRLFYSETRRVGLLDQMNLTDLVVGPMLIYVATFFVIMLPVLTMRLFAEERRQKTLELMLTLPVRPVEMVLGKYLAATIVMLIMLALTFVYPVLLENLAQGDLDWATVFTGYLGMALLGAAAVAIGLFASSVTDSQLIAVVIGFGILTLLILIGEEAQEQSGLVANLFEHASLHSHLGPFARGLIRLRDIVYYASVSSLTLFLCYRVIESQRWK